MHIDQQSKDKCFSEVDLSHARETVMLQRILERVKEFYSSSENIKAFQKWLDLKNNAANKNE